MLRFLKKLIHSRKSTRSTSQNNGQVALILILLSAISIIFFAISLNFGKSAELKTLTAVASNASAALMASSYASYTEQLYQTQLGGEKGAGSDLTICGFTGVLQILIIVVAIAVIVVLQQYELIAIMSQTLAVLALAVATAALALQITVVQPGLTSIWNKMFANMPKTDGFLERGILAALQNVVTDPGQIDDLHDMDLDGAYVTASGTKVNGGDQVSRFGFYYTKRLESMQQSLPDEAAIQAFIDALKGYLNFLWDPVDCSLNPAHVCCSNDPPAECNPCCVDKNQIDPRRPACCDDPDPTTGCASSSSCLAFSTVPECCDDPDPTVRCGYSGAAHCAATSPYGSSYPYVYNSVFEDSSNNRFSYLELFGKDDENQYFRMQPARNMYVPSKMYSAAQSSDPEQPLFRFDDTRDLAAPGEVKYVYPIFYKLLDWGMDLGGLLLDSTDKNRRYECNICDPSHPRCGNINPILTLPGSLAVEIAPQFTLPTAPGLYNGGPCIFDNTNPVDTSKKILRPDMVKSLYNLPDPTKDLLVAPMQYATTCGQDYVAPFTNGKWKRGADRYCSTVWPYAATCAKYGTTCTFPDGTRGPCMCGQLGAGPPSMWPDDPFDDFVYGVEDFIKFATQLINMDMMTLRTTFREWYPTAAQFLVAQGNVDQFYNDQNGQMLVWRDQHQAWIDKLNYWLTLTFKGTDCNQALCIPNNTVGIQTTWPTRNVGTPPGMCAGMKAPESAVMGTGTLDNILACLDYNITNLPKFGICGTASADVGQIGTATDKCRESNCADLPRSLLINDPVSPFDTNYFVVPRDPDVGAFDACLRDCTKCSSLPTCPTPWQGPSGPLVGCYPTQGVINPGGSGVVCSPATQAFAFNGPVTVTVSAAGGLGPAFNKWYAAGGASPVSGTGTATFTTTYSTPGIKTIIVSNGLGGSSCQVNIVQTF